MGPSGAVIIVPPNEWHPRRPPICSVLARDTADTCAATSAMWQKAAWLRCCCRSDGRRSASRGGQHTGETCNAENVAAAARGKQTTGGPSTNRVRKCARHSARQAGDYFTVPSRVSLNSSPENRNLGGFQHKNSDFRNRYRKGDSKD